MNATLTASPSTALSVTGRPGVPFGRLVRTELRKLTDTRAGRWLLLGIVSVTLLVIVIALFTAPTKDLTYRNFVGFAEAPQDFLLPILGILAITSEWSQRTGLVTFTLEPNRGRVLRAKVTATTILGLAVIATAFATAAIGNLLGIALRGSAGSWRFGVEGFRDIVIVQLLGLTQGMAFGMVLLISAAAIVVYFALPLVWMLLFTMVTALKDLGPWVDLGTATQPLYDHVMTGKPWSQLVVSALIWIGVPLVLGVIRVLRSEVKSA